MKVNATPVTRHSSLVAILMLALAGCAGTVQPLVMEDNYLTYEHAFTDAAALSVQRNAEKMCAQRKQSAIKTRSVCSLKECTTHYQCVDPSAGISR
jgi:hypothetical protein